MLAHSDNLIFMISFLVEDSIPVGRIPGQSEL